MTVFRDPPHSTLESDIKVHYYMVGLEFMKSIRLPSTKSSKLVLALKYVSSSMSTLLSSFSLELQLEYMLLLSVRPIEDCANISRLATTRFTGKHSPDEPNTMNRPRLPDAVGPKISIKAVNLIENVVLSSVFLTSFNYRKQN